MAMLVYQRVNVPTLQHLGIQCTNEYIQHLGIGENSPEKHAGNPSFGNHGILFFLKRSTDSVLDVQKGTNRCFIGRSSKIHPQCENRDCNRGWSVEIPQPAPLKDPKTRFETTISLCFISTKSSLALLLLHFFRVILCSLNGEILSVSGAIFEGQYLHVW